MRIVLVIALTLILAGCSGDFMAELHPDKMVPVYYPAATAQSSIEKEYGPTFRSVAGDYPEYQFN